MKLVAALDRYYDLDGRLGLPRAGQTGNALIAPPPLALTHAAEPVVPPLPSEVAQSGAQDVEIAGAPVDIARSAGCDGDPPLAPTHAAEPALPPLPSEVAQSGAQDVEIACAPIDIARSVGSDGDPPLALADAEPALPPLPSEVAQFGAQDVEIARAPIDIARSVGSDGDPLSPTPSPLFRRSRRKLHDLAPKTLKSQARLSTLHARSDEPEARRRRIIAGREAARRSRRTQCARRSSRLVPLPLYARGRNDDGLGGAGLALRGCAPRSMREALISSPAPPPPAQRGWRCS